MLQSRQLDRPEQLVALRRSTTSSYSAAISAPGSCYRHRRLVPRRDSRMVSSANAILDDDGASASLTFGGALAIREVI
jgi:hypothetical protein